MPVALLPLVLLSAAIAGEPFDPARVDLTDAIECRLDAPSYNGFAFALNGVDQLAAKRGWRQVKSGNFMMTEYELPAAITVAGHYATRRVAFTSNAVLAVLDLPDPAAIAREAGIENTMSAEPLIDAIVASGKATRAEVEGAMTFRKFLGEKTVSDTTELPVAGESFGARTRITRSISNASTHPGKTFYGCAYAVELIGRDGKPL